MEHQLGAAGIWIKDGCTGRSVEEVEVALLLWERKEQEGASSEGGGHPLAPPPCLTAAG